jgi:hypothetical protein
MELKRAHYFIQLIQCRCYNNKYIHLPVAKISDQGA